MTTRSTSLWSRAPSPKSRPGSAETDSTGASPDSPRTPPMPNRPSQDLISMEQTADQDNKLPPISELKDGRCAGPYGQVGIGSLVSVTHTGPEPQHASRCSSGPPLGGDLLSPTSTRHEQLGDYGLRQHGSIVPYSNGDERMQLVPQKTFGVHDILSRPEPRLLASGGSGPPRPAVRPFHPAISTQMPGSLPGSFQGARSFRTGHAPPTSRTGAPLELMTPLGRPASGRNPPTEAFSLPTLSNTMQEASPAQYHRAINAIYVQSNEADTRRPVSIHGIPTAKRPFDDVTISDNKPQYLNSHRLSGGSTGTPTISGPSWLYSQRPMASPGTQALRPTSPPGHAEDHSQLPPAHPQTSYTPSLQAGRHLPSPGPSSDSASSWPETLQRCGTGGSIFGAEGRHAFMKLPGSNAPIPVHMDFSHASKKADEKRQRNAVASTRHRRKKKAMEDENSKQLQKLRDERRMMEVRIEELTQQRDFYRDDRNRLRDIVAQTPSISGLAAGPLSPTISINNSYLDTGSMASGPPRSIGYGDEVLRNERPTKRQQTDGLHRYSLLPYSYDASGYPSAHSSRLLPMPIPNYTSSSCPSSAVSSASGEGLPLSKEINGRPRGPVPISGVQEQDPETGQWVTLQHRAPETGCATTDTHRRP